MPNIWLPEEALPGFRQACMDFYWVRPNLRGRCRELIRTRLPQTCHETELQILRAITVALGISEDYLVKYHKGHDNQLRLLHYPRLA